MLNSTIRKSQGFTLLEIIVGVTIFGIISIVIFSVFRGAIRSTRIGEREAATLQKTRVALDTFERDIVNLMFRDETSYNVAIAGALSDMEVARLRAEELQDWTEFYALYGNPEKPDEKGSIGNPMERGRMIDLQFVGKDAAESDSITFTIQSPYRIGVASPLPLGLARITWQVADGTLTRKEESVFAPLKIEPGMPEPLVTPVPPPPPRLDFMAENVRTFNLDYAFWYDNQWYEIADWDSTRRQIRNARYLKGTYEDDQEEDRPEDGTLRPGDPGWNQYLNDLDTEPLDRLPAYVRLRMTVASDKTSERVVTIERIFRIAGAEETYAPSEEVDETRREEERELRDAEYTAITPGAIDKQ